MNSAKIPFFLFLLFVVAIVFTNCKKDDNQPIEEILLPPCDSSIELADPDPLNGARAIDLCQQTTQGQANWGVINARYIRANGANTAYTNQIGIMSSFGSNAIPKRGEKLLVLSNGVARSMTQAGSCDNISCQRSGIGIPPAGFPQQVPNCPVINNIYDDIGLELTIRAPQTATGFSVDFIYYTFEYPNFVCTQYNDQFVIIKNPAPQGSINGNIAFDSNNTPVGVNINYTSTSNDQLMQGTGFGTWGSAACTGWLRTSSPVEGGEEFTLRFIIWDASDQSINSTVVIDNFQWLTTPTSVNTVKL